MFPTSRWRCKKLEPGCQRSSRAKTRLLGNPARVIDQPVGLEELAGPGGDCVGARAVKGYVLIATRRRVVEQGARLGRPHPPRLGSLLKPTFHQVRQETFCTNLPAVCTLLRSSIASTTSCLVSSRCRIHGVSPETFDWEGLEPRLRSRR